MFGFIVEILIYLTFAALKEYWYIWAIVGLFAVLVGTLIASIAGAALLTGALWGLAVGALIAVVASFIMAWTITS